MSDYLAMEMLPEDIPKMCFWDFFVHPVSIITTILGIIAWILRMFLIMKVSNVVSLVVERSWKVRGDRKEEFDDAPLRFVGYICYFIQACSYIYVSITGPLVTQRLMNLVSEPPLNII